MKRELIHTPAISRIINVDRYPLDRLETEEGKLFGDYCRQQLEENGSCLLEQFLLPDAIASALEDAHAAIPLAHQVNHEFSYDDINDETLLSPVDLLPEDHPRRHASLTYIRFIAKDLIAENNPVKIIHGSRCMTSFVGMVMGMRSVYPFDCPLSGCVLTGCRRGGVTRLAFRWQ